MDSKQAKLILGAFRAKIHEIKVRSRVIGYSIWRDGHWIAGPFETEEMACQWAFMAYGSEKETAALSK